MSFFHHGLCDPFSHGGLYDSRPSFTPLFRFPDDFDSYSSKAGASAGPRPRQRCHRQCRVKRPFESRFDVRETNIAWELQGELPGVDRDQISIKFTDDQTLVISGRTERTYATDVDPVSLVEHGTVGATKVEPEAEAGPVAEDIEEHGAPVKEQDGSGASDASDDAWDAHEWSKTPYEKYWVKERVVGEFCRRFSFPGRVNREAISATLRDGVLSLSIPKVKTGEARRITVN